MTEKIDFFISPEYCVPTTRISRRRKLIRTAASEFVLWIAGSRLAEVQELAVRGTHQHLAHEEGLAGQLADAQDLARVAAVGTGQRVHQEEPALGEVADDLLADAHVVLLGEGHVDVAPRDAIVHVGRVHDKAVMRRAARVLSRGHREGTGAGEHTLTARDGRLHEHGRRRVDDSPVVGMVDSVLLELLDDHWNLRSLRAQVHALLTVSFCIPILWALTASTHLHHLTVNKGRTKATSRGTVVCTKKYLPVLP